MKHNTADVLGEITRRRGISYYHQLYTLLAAALADGAIAAGSALPSETELMARFAVSRNTVRRALGQLEKEKRIIRRRGSGSYARNPPTAAISLEKGVEVVQSVDSAQLQIVSRLLRVQSGPTPEFIRRRDPRFGDESLLIQRCHTLKAAPFMFSTSYVPGHLAPKLKRSALSRLAPLAALEAAGVSPASAEQSTTAVAADSLAARHLRVDLASALLCILRLIRDEDGEAIEHQSHLFRPDRFQLRSRWTFERSAPGLRWTHAQAADMPAWL